VPFPFSFLPSFLRFLLPFRFWSSCLASFLFFNAYVCLSFVITCYRILLFSFTSASFLSWQMKSAQPL
jgi:hypothetical protein